MSGTRVGRGTLVAAAAATVLLAAVSTVAMAAATGGRHHSSPAGRTCAAPALPGTRIEITLTDMNRQGRMPHGPMTPGRHDRMMTVAVTPSSAPHGAVSFVVRNDGRLTHELVVLPLPSGSAGQRAVGSDGEVDESGSLGEASASCAAGEGDGIAAGATGWVTLTLPPGRYELLCNLPGHYAAGMYAGFGVS